MTDGFDLTEVLKHVDPSQLSYQEWADVGMALKLEGYPCSVWDEWSRSDYARYHDNECWKKWGSFHRSEGVTGGTIVHLAMQQGWVPPQREAGHDLDLNGRLEYAESPIVGEGWVERRDIDAPAAWNPAQELIRYLETLFTPDEIFGYVMASTKKTNKDGREKWVPANKGIFTLQVGNIVQELKKGSDIETVLGCKYNREAGAWIRFNPLDGNGVNNENVADFRYALVESDNMELEAQNGLIRQLRLPVAVLMYSGGKSLHAIVRIEADDKQEYQKRVNYLYEVCKKNGMEIDTQNRNPSRLSRMPGCERGTHKQYIIDTNIGCKNFAEWQEWAESVNDDLPDMEELSDVWGNLPELAPELIKGVLREGHKMLVVGPSKAGKSYDLIELSIAIAEGRTWHGWKCAQGRVLYVNLELDRSSCLHRFEDVYTALQWPRRGKITIWNLRGRSLPMDKLASKLIRKAKDRSYKAVIIDPIYKVITGDENSADQMARFCNQFDKVCTELGAAVIYCHHHSKGSQGQKKSMDRASGSGVFARDPDALLDMIELEQTDELQTQTLGRMICRLCRQKADLLQLPYDQELSQDDQLIPDKWLAYLENRMEGWRWGIFRDTELAEVRKQALSMSAWRIEGTLREFPKFEPVNCWFKHPIHVSDESGALSDIEPEMETSGYQKMKDARKKSIEKQNKDMIGQIELSFESHQKDGSVAVSDIAEEIGVAPDTIKRWFGKGKRSRSDYKQRFETYENEEDHRLYLRRKQG